MRNALEKFLARIVEAGESARGIVPSAQEGSGSGLSIALTQSARLSPCPALAAGFHSRTVTQMQLRSILSPPNESEVVSRPGRMGMSLIQFRFPYLEYQTTGEGYT